MASSGSGLAIILAMALLTAPACGKAAPPTDATAANKAVVLGFLDTVFNQHKVAEGFSRYVGDTYTQHNPHVPDGPAPAVKGLGNLVAANPEMHLDFKRTLAQGDLVAVQSHQVEKPGERGQALIDIFRVKNGRIVEHWDVIEDVPEESKNQNTMF